MTDIARLRELAEKATPGPWVTDDPNGELVAGLGPDGVYEYVCNCSATFGMKRTWSEQCANAAHIAALNPQAVLALLTELETLRAREWEMRKALLDIRRELRATQWSDTDGPLIALGIIGSIVTTALLTPASPGEGK